jgi:hypothetical protein
MGFERSINVKPSLDSRLDRKMRKATVDRFVQPGSIRQAVGAKRWEEVPNNAAWKSGSLEVAEVRAYFPAV